MGALRDGTGGGGFAAVKYRQPRSQPQRLRLEKAEAAGICVHVQTSMHIEEPYLSTGAGVSIPIPANSTAALIKAAMEALGKCNEPGHGCM